MEQASDALGLPLLCMLPWGLVQLSSPGCAALPCCLSLHPCLQRTCRYHRPGAMADSSCTGPICANCDRAIQRQGLRTS